ISTVDVASRCVRLPDLQQRLGHRPALLVRDGAMDNDPFPDGLVVTLALPGEVGVGGSDVAFAESGTGEFGAAGGWGHQGVVRGTKHRRAIPVEAVWGVQNRHIDPWLRVSG